MPKSKGRPPKVPPIDTLFNPSPTGTPIERVGTGRYRLPASVRPHAIRSVRAYRRMADALLMAAAAGKIRWLDAKQGIAAIETAASMFMGEKVLQRSGVSDVEDDHILGEDGGLVLPTKQIRSAVTRTVTRTTGVDRFGNPISITKVVEQDAAEPSDVEVEAEVDDGAEAENKPELLPPAEDEDNEIDPELANEIG